MRSSVDCRSDGTIQLTERAWKSCGAIRGSTTPPRGQTSASIPYRFDRPFPTWCAGWSNAEECRLTARHASQPHSADGAAWSAVGTPTSACCRPLRRSNFHTPSGHHVDAGYVVVQTRLLDWFDTQIGRARRRHLDRE